MTKRRGNPPTMQTIRRHDGSQYQTIDPRQLGRAGAVQIVQRQSKQHWLMRATLIIAVLILISLSASAGLLLPR